MLISEEYKQMNADLHQSRPTYGIGGYRWVKYVTSIANLVTNPTLLDYGCGKATLAKALPELNIMGYDPAVEGFQAEPEPVDIVICTDVMEHIEPKYLDDVLKHIRKLAKKYVLFAIATRPARKYLPDGRNAHLIIKDRIWWINKLLENFHVLEQPPEKEGEIIILAKPKGEGNDSHLHRP